MLVDLAGQHLHATGAAVIPQNAMRGLVNFYIHLNPKMSDDGKYYYMSQDNNFYQVLKSLGPNLWGYHPSNHLLRTKYPRNLSTPALDPLDITYEAVDPAKWISYPFLTSMFIK